MYSNVDFIYISVNNVGLFSNLIALYIILRSSFNFRLPHVRPHVIAFYKFKYSIRFSISLFYITTNVRLFNPLSTTLIEHTSFSVVQPHARR